MFVKKKYFLNFIFFSFVLIPKLSFAEVLFEGYYRVLSFNKHVGYLIVRSEIDATKKEFKYTSYLKLGKNGFDYTESLKALSDHTFKPLGYEYTMLDKGNGLIFDLKFKEDKKNKVRKITGYKIETTAGKPPKKTDLVGDLPEGVFLASSLYYVILTNPSGLKPNVTFNFKAFAEEQGKIFDGKSSVTGEKITLGQVQAYKVKNEYAGSEYENTITERGEILSSSSAAGISTELVATTSQATEGLTLDEKIIKKLFGDIPKGISNKIFEPKKALPNEPTQPGKTIPSPETDGVILKPVDLKSPETNSPKGK